MKRGRIVLKHKNKIYAVGAVFGIMGILAGCARKTQEAPILAQADLVIYTVQEPSVYEPVIKEFEERTNLAVDVRVGTTEELKQMLENDQAEREKPSFRLSFSSFSLPRAAMDTVASSSTIPSR